VEQLSRNLHNYFDILTVLAEKDFKIRYRNSVLGFLWSLLNPLAYMVILTLVFSFLLRVSIPNFAPWVLIGLLVWRFFSIGTAQGLGSIVANPSLLTLSTTEVAGIHASTLILFAWVGIPLLRFHPHPSHRRSIGQAIGLTAYPP